ARTAHLLAREQAAATGWRLGAGALGGVAAPLLLLADSPRPPAAAALAVAGLVAVLAGELLERWQFFTAVAAPRMPGGIG
ncbi:MAG: DmsC/YnfH family molybdoenzyme membrane anchor subunit, partial [Acidimicrobiales bacterium]